MKFKQPSEKQVQAIFTFSMANLVVQGIAGRLLLRHNKRVEEQAEEIRINWNNHVEVGKAISRIAVYQQKLLEKHVLPMHLDDFDELVITDMGKELDTQLKKAGWDNPPQPEGEE